MGVDRLMKTFKEITESMVELYEAKNNDYAKGGDEHGNFSRVANIMSNYPNLKPSDPVIVAITYMLKQLDAVLWAKNNGYETKVETLDEKYQDISIYSIIAWMINTKQEETNNYIINWNWPASAGEGATAPVPALYTIPVGGSFPQGNLL